MVDAASPLVLVTIDGARWQEIFHGSDPNLARSRLKTARELVPNLARISSDRGAAVGAPGRGVMRASGPNFVSLPGYTELLSGRPPNGCSDNGCKRTAATTLLDQANAAGASVAVFSSWERIDLAATARPGRFFVSCGRQGDRSIDPAPGLGDFRPDRYTAALALAYLEREAPDVLYLGLGDTDEYAHHASYDEYLGALSYADAVIGNLIATLERMGERGRRTHVVVTTDHGRARDFRSHGFQPEAARVWLVAMGPQVTARGLVASPQERRLSDVAPTLRVVMGLSPDRAPAAGHALSELFAATH